MERPILFLDVDGPLIPFGPSFRQAQAVASGSGLFPDRGNPLLERLNPAIGPRLRALGCDLVWATTWRDEANESVAPRLGLPRLPVVEWPEAALYVRPDRIGTGTGRRLMEAARSWAIERGYRRLELWVLADNVRARRFYASAGFSPDGTERVEEYDGVALRDLRYVAPAHGHGRRVG